jgi:hypothetical protein
VSCGRDARKAWRFQCENASRPTHQHQADDADCVECVDGLLCLEANVGCEDSLNAYHDSPNCEPQETECPAAFHPETEDAEICWRISMKSNDASRSIKSPGRRGSAGRVYRVAAESISAAAQLSCGFPDKSISRPKSFPKAKDSISLLPSGEIAHVVVGLNHVASVIENPNHSAM